MGRSIASIRIWPPQETKPVMASRLIDYPFPLRGGEMICHLHLPIDLTMAEVRRLGSLFETLVIPASPGGGEEGL